MNAYLQFYNERRFSKITDPSPDHNLFPLYYDASVTSLQLNPEDCLFIPAGWPHITITESDDINITGTFFYKPTSGIQLEVSKYKLDIDMDQLFPQDKEIEVRRTKTNCFVSNLCEHRFKGMITTMYMTFQEFIELNYKRLAITIKYNELNLPIHSQTAESASIRVNIGKNMSTQLHFDAHDSVMCQIQGTKKVLVFPPKELNKLYFFNTYDLQLIEEINKSFYLDKYVFIKPYSIHQLFCDKLKDHVKAVRTRCITDDSLTNLFVECREWYKQTVQKEHMWLDYANDLPKSFFVKDTREENETVIDSMDSCITVLFAANKGQIKVAKVMYDVNPGDAIIFPSSITHPWMSMMNTIVVYPNFNSNT
jgi:hypothetical protein